MAQGPGSTRQNNGPFTVGGFYNFAPFTLTDGQACSLQFDVNGNLKVTSIGGGGGSNPAAGPTGAPVPADADYLGINISGTLFGVTGFNLPDSIPIAVAIVNANGDQITSFGGGTQYVDGTAESIGAFTGTVAFGYNGTDVVGLRMDASDNLLVNLNTPIPAGTNLIGQIEVSDGTNVLFTNTHAGYVQFPSAQAVTLASTTITGNVSVTQAAASNPWIVAGNLTHNSAAPAATEIGVLPALANAAAPTYSEGFQVLLSTDLAGNLRVIDAADGSVSGGTAGTFSQLAGGIYNPTPPALIGGQQASLQLTAAGALIVSNSGGSSGAVVDESPFTLGVSSETPVGGVYLGGSNVPTVSLNQTGALQITNDRKLVVSDPAMTILLDYVQTLILETRAMRSAIVYMITENQDVLTSDFDPNNQDFQPVN